LGNPVAQNAVALCYQNGWNVEHDLELSAEWFERAALQVSETGDCVSVLSGEREGV